MILIRIRYRLSLLVCLACHSFAASGVAAPVLLSDLPDFYQHQLSGTDASSPFGRPALFTGYSDPIAPSYSTLTPTDDGGPGIQWERNGGWCSITAFTDVFYRLDKQGVTGLFDHGGDQTWLERMDYAISDFAIKAWGFGGVTRLGAAGFIDATVGAGQVRIDRFTWDAQLATVLCNGDQTPYPSMYSAYASQLALGHSAVLNLVNPGASNPDWWWSRSYHMVAAAGYDDLTSAIYFADPNGSGTNPAAVNWGHPYGLGDPLPVGPGYYQSSIMDEAGLLSGGGSFSGALVKDIYVLSIVPEPSTYAMALAGLAGGGFSLWRRQRARLAASNDSL